jgi:hypothetical protein
MITPSFQIKLERADEHLKLLEEKIGIWLDSRPYTKVDYVDLESGDDIVRVQFKPVPSEIPPLIGDCLHNLRCSLDYIVHALALCHTGALTEEQARIMAFPIIHKPDGWSRGVGRLRYVSTNACDIIRNLQPYHAGEDAIVHPLWVLEQLQNIDKHRALLLTPTTHTGVTLDNPLRFQPQTFSFSVVNTAEVYAEVARYRFVKPEDGSRVKVNIEPSVQICFGNPPAERREVIATLKQIRAFIFNEVFPKLFSLT